MSERKCQRQHRRMWAICDGHWLWCPDCGAITRNAGGEKAAWAYPGDREAAMRVHDEWEARREQARTP